MNIVREKQAQKGEPLAPIQNSCLCNDEDSLEAAMDSDNPNVKEAVSNLKAKQKEASGK